MDHYSFQSKLNLRVVLKVKDSLLTLSWSERTCDSGWTVIPLPSSNAGLLRSCPHILLCPDICVTTNFILLKQLLLNTVLNILLSTKGLNTVGHRLNVCIAQYGWNILNVCIAQYGWNILNVCIAQYGWNILNVCIAQYGWNILITNIQSTAEWI
jgi:hypothetical protein